MLNSRRIDEFRENRGEAQRSIWSESLAGCVIGKVFTESIPPLVPDWHPIFERKEVKMERKTIEIEFVSGGKWRVKRPDGCTPLDFKRPQDAKCFLQSIGEWN
jgi:hypothetical protein